ncbi:glycoside hydrolase family 16 protein, partial [Candidatus Acetothermia bacterium]|nr:glycoside hydrolase family 16 protein [Candidatus Acetothermia bacterium]
EPLYSTPFQRTASDWRRENPHKDRGNISGVAYPYLTVHKLNRESPVYNEIDVFETENGTDWNLTTHTRQGQAGVANFYHHHKMIRARDNSKFSDDFNTYAIKWEPNKVIYYLNNKIVRVVTDHIADHNMYILANLELDGGTRQDGRGQLADAVFPNYYDIDYIRVYQRADHRVPDPVFMINGVRSFSYTSPVQVKYGRPLRLNGIESYSPDSKYFVAVQQVNGSGVPIGFEAMGWLTPAEVQKISNFNLKKFSQSKGLILGINNTYKVKLVSAGSPYPWVEQNQYFKLIPCTNSMDFTINGKGASPIVVDYEFGFPSLSLDASASAPCDNNYFLSIEPSNANWDRLGGEVNGWLTAQEIKNIDHLDLYAFALARGLTLQYNSYYRVVMAAGNPWTPVGKLLRINPVSNFIDFSINADNGGTYQSVEVAFNPRHPFQPPLVLEGYRSKTSYRIPEPFMVSVETSDQYWGRAGDEKTGWYSADKIKHFDLRQFAADKGLSLNYGSYYRVGVATNFPWTVKALLLHLAPCTSVPDFTINGKHRTDFTPITVGPNQPVRLSAWNSVSCYPNKYHFLSVQRSDQSGYVVYNPEVMEWLDDDLTIKMGRPEWEAPENLGWYDVKKYASDRGLTLLVGNYYRIKLCTIGPNWDCHQSIIYMSP